MENKIASEYHSWWANKKIMDIINKQDNSRETLRLTEKQQEIKEPSNIWFNFDNTLDRNVWFPSWPDKRRRDEAAAIELEMLFRKNERNRWGDKYILFNEPRTNTSTNAERISPEPTKNVSSTEESGVARPTARFHIVYLKDYDISNKTFHYNQLNHIIEEPIIVNAKADKNLKKAEFDFIVDQKTLIHKSSVDPKVLQLRICPRKKPKRGSSRKNSPIFVELTERFCLLFAGHKVVKPEVLKKKVLDSLHFGHPSSTKNACRG